jgi:hypothetical protein
MNREAIYGALYALVAGAASFVTTSRRLRHWTDVPAAEQPALFQVQKGEVAKTRRGQPTEWTLSVDLYVYGQAPDEATSSASVLNPLIDAVAAALAPSGSDLAVNAQTLGGLVSHCWIAGKIETDEGALGGQAVAIVPIEMIVAA